MKRLLILGAGQSASYLLQQLFEDAEQEGWFVTVADRDERLATMAVGNRACGEAVRFNVNDAALRSAMIKRADVVINMLPAAFQHLVAWDCVNHSRHMISVSYRDQAVRDLDLDAKRKGVLLLCEMGLDPGIDHMSAMSLIQALHDEGAHITEFASYGSGIPAPGQHQNRLQYAITWDPHNVAMAGNGGAQYMEDGKIKIVPFQQLFDRTWNVEVDGVGQLEAYANRDSMAYLKSFGLENDPIRTMLRGTLRYPGWSETWAQIVKLGLPNETQRIPNLANRSYAEVIEMFLPFNAKVAPLEQRVARLLGINPTGRIMENLRWLGLFSEERIGCRGNTAAAMLIHILQIKLPLTPEMRDMVLLVHQVDVTYADTRPDEQVCSTLVLQGEAGGITAMSRAVGLPVLIAVKLLLAGKLSLHGSRIPTHPGIYDPILARIERAGLHFTQKRRSIEPPQE